jgi:hypothetical protein
MIDEAENLWSAYNHNNDAYIDLGDFQSAELPEEIARMTE